MSEQDIKKVHYRIMDITKSERPRERLASLGAQYLTTADLLAILLRVGVAGVNAVQLAHNVLLEFKGVTGLYRAPFEEVCQLKGIGVAKAAQIKAALELGHRMSQEENIENPSINSPADAAALVQYKMSNLEQEELWVICLNTRNRVINTKPIYRGSLLASQVRIGELFRLAIRLNAASIIVVHNHPSGDPTPSPEDVVITRAILQAGKILDIEVLDHLVIGYGGYISLKERGLGFAG